MSALNNLKSALDQFTFGAETHSRQGAQKLIALANTALEESQNHLPNELTNTISTLLTNLRRLGYDQALNPAEIKKNGTVDLSGEIEKLAKAVSSMQKETHGKVEVALAA